MEKSKEVPKKRVAISPEEMRRKSLALDASITAVMKRGIRIPTPEEEAIPPKKP